MVDTVASPIEAKSVDKTGLVIAATSLGSLFEWYDFFLYGAVTPAIARHFFDGFGFNDTTSFILALGVFAAGFVARPFGAVLFGRVGDMFGRKRTFIVTMALMGVATFLVGVLPGAERLGLAAPILLVLLRIIQGLALGGEYGGAAIYVAEHTAPERRGLATSWINATGGAGFVLALVVIIVVHRAMNNDAAFQDHGWRIPFLLSVFLLVISLWIRLRLSESPVFQRMLEEGTTTKAPFVEAFGSWAKVGRAFAVVFGCIVGGTTIWYTAQVYSLLFLQRALKVDELTADILVAVAIAVAVPSYLFFGWLSDRIGRKPIIVLGAALSAVLIFPLFHQLTEAANPALAAAATRAPITVIANPASCSFQFDPLNASHFDTRPCDIAKSFLSHEGVSYRSMNRTTTNRVVVEVGLRILTAPDPAGMSASQRLQAIAAFQADVRDALKSAGYPDHADAARINMPLVVVIVAVLVFLAAMTYAPLAAFLVELFPARVRYTSLSVPYHLGVGVIGGFMPATAFAMVAATGDVYWGLWYPVAFNALSTLVALFFLPETRGRGLD